MIGEFFSSIDRGYMTIRALRTLLAIERHGGFGAAGKVVGLTPSAVSLQVRDLERRVQARLFERVGRTPRLTPAGHLAIARAREIVRLYDELPGALAATDEVTGTLMLGAIPTTLTGFLPDALARLRKRHPLLRVRLVAGLSAELAAAVERGELDAALTTEPMERLGATIAWTAVTREKLAVIAPPGARGRDDKELLESHPLIRFNRRAWAGRLIDAELRRRRIAVVEGMELDSLEAIARMVKSGLGASIVPARLAALPEARGLRVVPFGKPPLTRTVGLIARPGSSRAGSIAALLAMLKRPGGRGLSDRQAR
jgi:DNA-binding transcriptional LysR family regulator